MNLHPRCVLVLLLALGGCSLEHDYPTKALFVPPPAELEALAADTPVAIQVPRAHVVPPFDSRQFQYRVGKTVYEPAYYAQWAGDPGSLLSAVVADGLASTGAFAVLPEAAGHQVPVVTLRVTGLNADVRDTASPTAVLSIGVTVLDHQGNVMMTHAIDARVRAASENPADINEAWGRGLAQGLQSLAPEMRSRTQAKDPT